MKPSKVEAFKKSNTSQAALNGNDNGPSYLQSPTKLNKNGMNEFKSNFNPLSNDAPASQPIQADRMSAKAKDLVGNCPIDFNSNVTNKEIKNVRK